MRWFAVLAAMAVTACTPIDPNRAADRCEERARAAQGPETRVEIGTNSASGTFASGNISVSSDFLRGLDPIAVYERCVFELTGELPIRPPVLRDL